MTATAQLATANGNNTTAATTQFVQVGVTAVNRNATEAVRQNKWRCAGTFSNLYVKVSANAATTSSTVTFRKAGADGNLTLSIGAGQTGEFEDTSHTDSVAAGDLVGVKIVTGATGGLTLEAVGTLFEPSSVVAYSSMIGNAATNITSASQTAYLMVSGSLAAGNTTEADSQYRVQAPFTAKNFQVYVSANARTTTTTFRSRKNTANGAMSVAVGSTQTGLFEDTSNSDTLGPGDLYDYQYVSGTGTQTLTVELVGAGFESGDVWQDAVVANAASYTNNNVSVFLKTHGLLAVDTTEADSKLKLKVATKATNLRIRLSANARAVTQTVTLRKNGADTAQTLTIGASQTGLFEDTSDVHTVDVAASDDLSIGLATGASASSATIRLAGVTLRDPETAPYPAEIATGSTDRLLNLEGGQSAIHLSDGTLVSLHRITTGGSWLLVHHGADHASPTLIASVSNSDFVTGSGLALCRDDLDNLYLIGSNSTDLRGKAYTKGVGYSWTAQTALIINSNSGDVRQDATWCDTGGGTSSAGHIISVTDGGGIGANVFVDVTDAGALLAGSGTAGVNHYTNPVFVANGNTLVSASYSLSADGFGATSGICFTVGTGGTEAWVGKWGVNSSGALSTNTFISSPAFNGTPRKCRAIRYASDRWALVAADNTSTSQLSIARFSSTAQLTAATAVGTPTSWPNNATTLGWDAYLDPSSANKVWLLALGTLSGTTVPVWRLSVDVTSGVSVASTATAEDNLIGVDTKQDSLRVVKEPVGYTVNWDSFQKLTGSNYGLLNDWTTFAAPLASTWWHNALMNA